MSADRQIAEALADPSAPRRGIAGDHEKLTAEERSRLITVDPYAGPRSRSGASSEDAIELELIDAAGLHRRVKASSATRGERDAIVRMVEDGRAVLCMVRPGWWAEHATGRVRTHVWAEPPKPQRPASDRVDAARAAQRAAESARQMSTAWPSSVPAVHRPPTSPGAA